jgi:hypothetical protein
MILRCLAKRVHQTLPKALPQPSLFSQQLRFMSTSGSSKKGGDDDKQKGKTGGLFSKKP